MKEKIIIVISILALSIYGYLNVSKIRFVFSRMMNMEVSIAQAKQDIVTVDASNNGTRIHKTFYRHALQTSDGVDLIFIDINSFPSTTNLVVAINSLPIEVIREETNTYLATGDMIQVYLITNDYTHTMATILQRFNP